MLRRSGVFRWLSTRVRAISSHESKASWIFFVFVPRIACNDLRNVLHYSNWWLIQVFVDVNCLCYQCGLQRLALSVILVRLLPWIFLSHLITGNCDRIRLFDISAWWCSFGICRPIRSWTTGECRVQDLLVLLHGVFDPLLWHVNANLVPMVWSLLKLMLCGCHLFGSCAFAAWLFVHWLLLLCSWSNCAFWACEAWSARERRFLLLPFPIGSCIVFGGAKSAVFLDYEAWQVQVFVHVTWLFLLWHIYGQIFTN